MQNIKPLISVILPVYNAIPFVTRALDSVIGQTFDNLEIICVDDGSTDGTSALLDQYAAKDARVHVIHKQNEGPHLARKDAMKVAVGEYISCVDADDWQDIKRYERLLPAMAQGFDIIMTNAGIAYDNIHQDKRAPYAFREGHYTRAEIEAEIFAQPQEVWENPFGMPLPLSLWEAVFKRELLQEAMSSLSNDMYMAEDSSCFLLSLLKARSLFVTNDYSYVYHKRQGSLCHKTYSAKEQGRVSKGLLALCGFYQKVVREAGIGLREQLRTLATQSLYHSFILAKCDLLLTDGKDGGSIFPFAVPLSAKIVIYGAGSLGQRVYGFLSMHGGNVVLWCDRSYKKYATEGMPVASPKQIEESIYDYVVIAIERYAISSQVRKDLIGMGIPDGKIRLIQKGELTDDRLDRVIYKLKQSIQEK